MNIGVVNGINHAIDRRSADEEMALANEEALQSSTAYTSGTSLLLLEGDISAQIAALAVRSAQRQRETNRDIHVAEEASLQRAEEQQVQALHQKADDIRMAGAIEGAAGMCSGAFTIGGSFAATESDKQFDKGLATLSDASGKALVGVARANQADQDANAATHEHEAGHHRRNLDAARDGIREGQDLLERALDFYKQSQQSANDAVSSSVWRA
jgi:hypothetical protein